MNEAWVRGLELEPERVGRVAVAYAGYGLARWHQFDEQPEETRDPNTLALAANAFARAGEYFAVTDADSARLVFWAAANCYVELGLPRSLLYAVCAQTEFVRIPEPAHTVVPSPEDAAARLLYDAYDATRRIRSGERYVSADAGAREEMSDTMKSANVAETRTQLRTYQQFRQDTIERATNVSQVEAPSPDVDFAHRSSETVVAIVAGAADMVHRARQDRFHWRNLQSAVSPAPAEALAAGVVYFSGSDAIDELLRPFEGAPFAAEALVLAYAALELQRTGARRDFPSRALRELAARRGAAHQ